MKTGALWQPADATDHEELRRATAYMREKYGDHLTGKVIARDPQLKEIGKWDQAPPNVWCFELLDRNSEPL